MNVAERKSFVFESLVIFLLFWVVFQDFILSLVYNITNNIILTNLLFYSKDVIFICLFIWSLFRGVSKNLFVGFIVFSICVLFALVNSLFKYNFTISTLLQSVRGVIILPCFICIGDAIIYKNKFKKVVVNKYFNFIVFVACFGIFEYFLDQIVGTANFWRNTIGITDFFIDIKGQEERIFEGLPGNFYGQYGNDFFSVKRLVSIWVNPLTAAYVMALPFLYFFIISLQNREFKNLAKAIILGVSIYLTHTRAIILTICFVIFLYLLMHPTPQRKLFLFVSIICGIIFIILFRNKIFAFLYDGSTMGHINAITQSIENMGVSLFGGGFGQVGILGLVGSESQYLTVLGNMGIVGLMVYLYFLVYPLLKVKKYNHSLIGQTVFFIGIAYIITGFISEQLSAFTTIVPYYILVGLVFGETRYQLKKPEFKTGSFRAQIC